jgi:hypothetical protein
MGMASEYDSNNSLFDENETGPEPGETGVVARQRLREKMQKDVEAFLKAGGKIETVSASATAESIEKPTSEYGRRPI